MATHDHYDDLAALFDYPERDYPALVRRAHEHLAVRYPLAAAHLDSFAQALPSKDGAFTSDVLAEMQELFTRSFDVQAITTLSVGYVMFGDDYKRGELLVNLNREHRAAGVDCGSELPDHLPNLLRLIARWQDRTLVAEFVAEVLQPALTMMISEFSADRMEQRNRLYRKHFKTLIASSAELSRVFRLPLEALLAVLDADFGIPASRRSPQQRNDFLHSIGCELDIEAEDANPARPRSPL